MIPTSALLKHYKRKDIQEEIVRCAEDREIAVKFGEKGFGKRPDTLTYPQDILELAKQGATSFHASEELWKNPLSLVPGMKQRDIDDNRKGWDLVLDIDSDYFEYSKIAAHLLINAMKHQGIKSISCKFSGRAGFHIAIPFEAFPETVNKKETAKLFPDGARAIAAYLKEMIRGPLTEIILRFDDISTISRKTGKTQKELMTKDGKFNPFELLDIDTILISSRHLFRMPYTFNEKSGLVSIVIEPDEVMSFELADAKYETVKICKRRYLDRAGVVKGEATKLLVQAFDFESRNKTYKEEKETLGNIGKKEFEMPENAIPEECFPPCIKTILNGLKDGKKRSLFILMNFLRSCGWSYEQIEQRLKEWNTKNQDALREVIIKGQIMYHKKSAKNVLPPNCDNEYYKALQICCPDGLCSRVKNPVSYASRKGFLYNRKKKMDEEQAAKDAKRVKREMKSE